MLGSILANYGFGLWVDACKRAGRTCAPPLVTALAVNLGILFVFKYLTFTLGILNRLGAAFVIPGIESPIGISFFTFQALSYVLDVHRDRGEVQRSPLKVGLYISFFPQLIAGPIVKYETVAQQIDHRKEIWADFSAGCSRFIVGLGKKVLLSNQLAVVADRAFGQGDGLSASFAWLGALCYTLQIYYDFSGYSDMAIGLGKMFGFHFLENFNYPYISRSITEFWRRWHISLSTWFRDYVYFPWGQPGELQGQTHPQPVRGVVAHRRLARGQLDVPGLGTVLLRVAGAGKIWWSWPGLAGVGQMAVYLPDGELCLGAFPGGQPGGGGAVPPGHVRPRRRGWDDLTALYLRENWTVLAASVLFAGPLAPACGTGPRKRTAPCWTRATPYWRRRCSWCRRPS
ncbi:MAG: MBOAT family O-acyltransferase [Flavonifractor plautii]